MSPSIPSIRTQSTISIRTSRTYTYRPLTPASSTSSSPVDKASSTPVSLTPLSAVSASSCKIHKRIPRCATATKKQLQSRRLGRNVTAWPSKQCSSSTSSGKAESPASPAAGAGLAGYLALLEQQRDEVASRCSSASFSRGTTPESMVG